MGLIILIGILMKWLTPVCVHFCLFTSPEVPPTPAPYSCGDFSREWEPCLDQNSRTGEAVLEESMAEFSMKLYSSLRESYPSKNLLLSPLSISTLLSHLLLGRNLLWIAFSFCCIERDHGLLSESAATSCQKKKSKSFVRCRYRWKIHTAPWKVIYWWILGYFIQYQNVFLFFFFWIKLIFRGGWT